MKKNFMSLAIFAIAISGGAQWLVGGGETTPLHYASSAGHKDTVISLIRKGAKLNVFDRYHHTPLHKAAEGGRWEHTGVVIALIEAGADVNAKTKNGGPPLLRAAALGNKDAAIALMNAGADVNAKTKDNFTPLHGAAKGWKPEHKDIALELVRRGADPYSKDSEGKTSLDYIENAEFKEEVRSQWGQRNVKSATKRGK